MSPQEETLQPISLPTVTITPTNVNFNEFSQIILTTKVMKSLFPSDMLNLTTIGTLRASLKLELAKNTELDQIHSHNDELYGLEFVRLSSATATVQDTTDSSLKRTYSFDFPIFSVPNANSLLIIIDENFLKFSPIFDNVIARELVTRIKGMTQITLLGASDKIYKFRRLTLRDCPLNPPEFITGFIGSLMCELIMNQMENFEAIVVPSEGPVGFEKLATSDMQQLVSAVADRLAGAVDARVYSEECYKHWRSEGVASSTLSGLYI